MTDHDDLHPIHLAVTVVGVVLGLAGLLILALL